MANRHDQSVGRTRCGLGLSGERHRLLHAVDRGLASFPALSHRGCADGAFAGGVAAFSARQPRRRPYAHRRTTSSSTASTGQWQRSGSKLRKVFTSGFTASVTASPPSCSNPAPRYTSSHASCDMPIQRSRSNTTRTSSAMPSALPLRSSLSESGRT
jgi:hypothetical protein